MDMQPISEDNIGRRRNSRLRVSIPAQLVTLDGQPRVELCDLSRTGARLRWKHPLKRGEQAVLYWLGHEAFGRVMWVHGTSAGMEFDEPLDHDVLLETREAFDHGLVPSERDTLHEAARDWYNGYR